MSAALDEADHLKNGTATADPTQGTKVVRDRVPAVHTVKDMLDGAAARAMSREQVTSLTTGHYRLDQITGGLRRGFTWLFGADTSWGKSSFLISICDENIAAGKTCVIVSAEDAESVYADRLMCRRARLTKGPRMGKRIMAQHLRDKKLEPEELDAVLDAAAKAERKPLFLAANGEEAQGGAPGKKQGAWPLEDLLPHLSTLVREEHVDFVAFDYLQEFQSKQRFQDERLKFKAMAKMMRDFIRRHDITGVVFSQLTLANDTKIPTRHNIRECRDVANASDVILIGFEPDQDVKDKDGKLVVMAGKKCIYVDKVKNGPRGAKLEHEWDKDGACFDAVRQPKQQAYEWADVPVDNEGPRDWEQPDPNDPRFQ